MSIENQHQWSAKSKRVKEEESKRVTKNINHLDLLKGPLCLKPFSVQSHGNEMNILLLVLKRNKMCLARNKTRGDNLLLSGTTVHDKKNIPSQP